MKVTIKKSAEEELNKEIGDQKGYLKIQYETNRLFAGAGVPTLLFVPSKNEKEDVLFETSYLPVIIEKSQMFLFDKDLMIDYSDSANCFQLRSQEEIINGRMTFIK